MFISAERWCGLSLKRLGSFSHVSHIARKGDYALTRVDVAVHVDCGSSENAQALMIALREYIVGNAGDVSLYGLETSGSMRPRLCENAMLTRADRKATSQIDPRSTIMLLGMVLLLPKT